MFGDGFSIVLRCNSRVGGVEVVYVLPKVHKTRDGMRRDCCHKQGTFLLAWHLHSFTWKPQPASDLMMPRDDQQSNISTASVSSGTGEQNEVKIIILIIIKHAEECDVASRYPASRCWTDRLLTKKSRQEVNNRKRIVMKLAGLGEQLLNSSYETATKCL